MTTTNLISKLNKLGVSHSVSTNNGFNMDICFSINGKSYKAGYTLNNETITDYCRAIGYDQSSQETQRLFFNNFNHVLRNANN